MLALLLLLPDAHALSCWEPLPDLGRLGSPLRGPLPPGFALRPEGQLAHPYVAAQIGEEDWIHVELREGDQEQYWTPADSQPGLYELRDLQDGAIWTVEVVEDWTPETPVQDLQLVQVEWAVARDGPRFAPCASGDGRRHTYETLRLRIPSSPQPGWALRLEDPSTEMAWWMGLHPESREVSWTQDLEPWTGSVLREERCLSWALYDPLGQLEREGAFDCESREEAPGCSSSGRRPGRVGALLLFGLLLRRRGQAGQRAQAS